jgi:hypothetical protein
MDTIDHEDPSSLSSWAGSENALQPATTTIAAARNEVRLFMGLTENVGHFGIVPSTLLTDCL